MNLILKNKALFKNHSLKCILIFVYVFEGFGYVNSQSLDFKDLKRGAYNVGYTSMVKIDYSRTFIHKNDTIHRPILLNIWYPAVLNRKSKIMKQKEYFDFVSDNNTLRELFNAYRDYNISVIKELVFEEYDNDNASKNSSMINDFLNIKANVYKNPKPLIEKFPLIIYHQGFGASIEDNSVLLSYLASHGYVVIGSSFFQNNSKSLSSGNQESVHDINYIINFASTQQNIDINNIALIGHSGGAQASLIAKTHSQNPIKAVVSLDTTQEPFGLLDGRWQDFLNPTLNKIDNMNTNLLAFSNHIAVFKLFNLMKNAKRRYYITYPKTLNHNEYTSQGIYADYYKLKKANDNSYSVKDFEKDLNNYVSINRYILRFLDGIFKGENFQNELKQQNLDTTFDFSNQHIAYTLLKNETDIKPYAFNTKHLPNPMQAWSLAYSDEKELLKTLKYFIKDNLKAPIYSDQFAFALINQLINDEKISVAKQLLSFYDDNGIGASKRFISISNFMILMQRSKYAKNFIKNLLKISEYNKEAKKLLNKLNKDN